MGGMKYLIVCPFILTGLKALSALSSFGTYLKFYVASVVSAATSPVACVNAFQVMISTDSAYISGASQSCSCRQ